MSYARSVIIGATLAGLLAGLTHRSATPKPVVPPDNQFELTWDEMAALHKADRENLVPVLPRIWPEPAPPAKPVVEQVAAIVPAEILPRSIKPIKPIAVRNDWCTKHHMRRVYHDKRWWCRR